MTYKASFNFKLLTLRLKTASSVRLREIRHIPLKKFDFRQRKIGRLMRNAILPRICLISDGERRVIDDKNGNICKKCNSVN